ncbi:unnamed protein product [Arctogadus glacialis]
MERGGGEAGGREGEELEEGVEIRREGDWERGVSEDFICGRLKELSDAVLLLGGVGGGGRGPAEIRGQRSISQYPSELTEGSQIDTGEPASPSAPTTQLSASFFGLVLILLQNHSIITIF